MKSRIRTFSVQVLFTICLLAPAAAEGGYPVTVKDAWGADFTLRAKPTAIVSLTLPTDEILLELVEAKRLRAIDVFATDAGISNIAEAAQKIPFKISAEKERVIALQPDLVVVADWTDQGFVQSLREAGVPVFVSRSSVTFVDLKAAIAQLAALVGEAPRGQALIAGIDARLKALSAGTLSRSPPVTVLAYSFGGSTYGRGTSFDTLVTAAGLVNAASQAGLEGWPQLSKEQVLAFDPDLIVLPSWSWDGKDDPQKFLASFLADPAFAGLKAVRTHRVVILPERHLQATSQYMVDGVEDLVRAARK